LAALIVFINGSFYFAWSPVCFEKLAEGSDRSKAKLVMYTYVYFILNLLIALLVIFAAPFILKVAVGKDYYGAAQFIFWLGMANVFHSMYVIAKGYVVYSKRTDLVGYLYIIIVPLNIFLNYFFITRNGAIGAAQALFITYVIRFLIVFAMSQKVCPMPWLKFAGMIGKA